MNINKNRLFVASCFALVTTAFAFALRAGIMNNLTDDLQLTNTDLGWIGFMGAFGFPIATLVGGPMYNTLGPKKLGWIALICHFLGITLTILSGSFLPLLLSWFFISFGNGMVEAAYNPLITDMYPENKSTMLNKFHVWFPGGLAIGALLAFAIDSFGGGWELKIACMYVPMVIYAFLFYGQEFPKTENEMGKASTAENIKAIFSSPLYWLMLVCMALTATTELGTQSWVEKIIGNLSGANPMLVLALITSIMAFGRFFAGPIIHKLNITGVLFVSAIISTIAIGLLSTATGGMVYLYAVLFAVGVCYFWPNMIAFVAEYFPKTGALGMSLIGGVGMVGLAIFNPIIGGWLDSEKAKAATLGIPTEAAELAAGQATLDNIAVFPAILVVIFGILWLMRGKLEGMKHVDGLVDVKH